MIIPRELLESGPLVMWVYAHLSRLVDKNGVARIIASQWCNEIGLSRQQLRTAFNKLKEMGLVSVSSTTGLTTVTVFSTASGKEEPKARRSSKAVQTASSLLPDFVAPELAAAFKAWIDYKASEFNYKYKSESSLRAAYNRLVTLSGSDPQIAMKIVEQSMAHAWKGLFELKDNGNQTTSYNSGAGQRSRQFETLDQKLQSMLDTVKCPGHTYRY